MATIKAIEAQSVHQIQSGQVIVDFCSVVKELVENGLDAGATSIEVRFKNNGLDSIEVQDNGSGISPSNYDSVALKHYTSKLSVYNDLSNLQTFGFRGEALSSLCALSTFYMVTAQADEAPKGKRLDFEISGKLKSTSVVACQKGTVATVEGLFESLPVRRKELSKNIKREYGKVINLLHAYACVCTSVRFAVKNAMPKGKSMSVFVTKANATTRENIANVYGAKTLQALVPLDLELDFQSTLSQISHGDAHTPRIKVNGHISRPVWGEGRQVPDRQMFFVNGRPCGLPQVAKAMNEVYKSFNVSQSPFIFADFQMDTNAYDVNVSPDKRSILLHNATALVEQLKETLNTLFEKQDQTVPHSQVAPARLPVFKQLSFQKADSVASPTTYTLQGRQQAITDESNDRAFSASEEEEDDEQANTRTMLHNHFRAQASTREEPPTKNVKESAVKAQKDKEKRAKKIAKALAAQGKTASGIDEYDEIPDAQGIVDTTLEDSDDDEQDEGRTKEADNIKVRDFNQRMAEQQKSHETIKHLLPNRFGTPETAREVESSASHLEQQHHHNVVQEAFNRMRPQRAEPEIATITIGDHTTTAIVGSGLPSQSKARSISHSMEVTKKTQNAKSAATLQFSQSLRKYGAFGTQVEDEGSADEDQVSDKDDDLASETSGDHVTELRDASRTLEVNKAADENSDPDYIDAAEEKAEEEARVSDLIRLAEESAAKPSKESLRRADKVLKISHHKDSTTSLLASVDFSLEELTTELTVLYKAISGSCREKVKFEDESETANVSDEERLSLTVARSDFANMDIIGQFNLGFLLAVRRSSKTPNEAATPAAKALRDELFIIDQHASDEKYNFERFQASTIVSNQRLVLPIMLELTAVEEEIVLENLSALEKNGFVVEADTSGSSSVGQRCKLLTLPLSKEVTFNTRDLDELIHLLAESPTLNEESQVPRPTKVRKMFAMRACRNSIMIGKTLNKRQMSDVLRHMGEIDKPWNCPHGRPTMRHLTTLDVLGGWSEGDGLAGDKKEDHYNVWKDY